uniref:Uncharacterized protein n=1 Tax=Grammatophora oceanica TaxID=210454 RepID=A0A7S1UL21_9STRA|mmetsp:Transcript_10567/g.15380  ORF Transcript_10567/g.15380 Transcript_10567/m.15380 type:complete len:301 (+) Transcript_10567:168-1070(+)
MSDPPKRDKFASLAARQQQQQQAPPAAPPQPPPPQRATSPKRDKFASLAAKQKAAPATETATTSAVKPPKRDKFSSLQQGGGGGGGSTSTGGGKFAKLQQKQQETPSSDGASAAATAEAERLAVQKRKEALLGRIGQQRQVLKDMEKAEGMVWNLIHLAKETAEGLADLKPSPQQDDAEEASPDLSALSQNYRTTLSQIHGLLKPHAHLVKAYENHRIDEEEPENDDEEAVDAEKKKKKAQQETTSAAPNMYAARVEMRLALEKQQVLKALLELENQESSPTGANEAMSIQAVGEKRKRD